MARLTAQAPLPVLLDALARAGWADLDGRAAQGVRSVLRALAALLPHGSASGLVTANQIADAAGLKQRQTRDNLQVLEVAGLIVWTRGGIRDGRPVPGAIKVNKRGILDLVRKARRELPERLRTRATETAQRLRDTLNARTIRNRDAAQAWRRGRRGPDKRQDPLPHAAFSATPSPYGEVTGRPTAPPPSRTAPINDIGMSVQGTNLGAPLPAGRRRWHAVLEAMAATGSEAAC